MELREALTQIEEIRMRLARTEVFRGYRALPVALSGFFAVVAGLLQPLIARDPMRNLDDYLSLWGGIAILSIIVTGMTMFLRDQLFASPSNRAITKLAISQFLPCLVTGALVTIVFIRAARESAWMLPGLWQILFSQGIFASCRLLPKSVFAVGCFYLGSGLVMLTIGREMELSPWLMTVPFAVGQLATAAILYWTLERHDEQ